MLRSSSLVRIGGYFAERLLRLDHLVGDERRHDLARLADHHLDRSRVSGLDAVEQAADAGERREDHALGERVEAGRCCGHRVSILLSSVDQSTIAWSTRLRMSWR